MVLHFLQLTEEICEDLDHYLGIDFLISCVRKFERGVKENVLFRPVSEEDKMDVNVEEAMKYLVVIHKERYLYNRQYLKTLPDTR